MFLEKVNKSPNLLNYLLGFFIIATFYVIGQFPLAIALLVKSFGSGKPMPTTEAEIMKFFSPNVTLFLMLLIFVFTMLGIIIVVKYLHKLKLKDIITSREKVDWKRIFFAFVVWGVISSASTLIVYFASPENFVLNFKPIPFLILLLIAMIMLPIQTSTEEFIFRGYLMQGVGLLAKNRWVPLIVTSTMFGLMHIMNPEVAKMGQIIMVYYIGTGFFLGIITLMDDGMELSLGFHAANNIVTALLVTSEWSALQTESVFKDVSTPSVGYEILIPILVVFPLLLFIFSKKYHWTNWKQKLTGKIKIQATAPLQKNENHE
ncbi:MAG: CPBP family intramembrane metalloprotease [Flavobacterium sp. JAD_PAG50586_2]|nr:MAG: CPBP family intramembrane metalloprotease [Flavobacterium sp. JAD_PAG50586_2]